MYIMDKKRGLILIRRKTKKIDWSVYKVDEFKPKKGLLIVALNISTTGIVQ